MRASGKVNVFGLLLFGATAAGLYWALVVGPLYIDNMDVSESVAKGFGQRGNLSEERIRTQLATDLRQLRFGEHQEYDRSTGEMKTEVGLDIPDEQILVQDDVVRKELLIRVTYNREVVLWPSKKKRTIHFVVERKGAY